MENGNSVRAAGAPSKPKLTRLKIESFRGVAPCELRFSSGFNVLLGLNATGKTTLLELIVASLSFDFSRFGDEPFAVEYELSFSTGTIVTSMRNEHVAPRNQEAISPLIEAPGFQVRDTKQFVPSTQMHIHFTSLAKEWTVRADGTSIWLKEEPESKSSLQTHQGKRGPDLLFRAIQLVLDDDFDNDKSPLWLTYQNDLWSWASACRFDEALDLFRDITSASTWIEVRVDRARGAALGASLGGVIPRELLSAFGAEVVKMSGEAGQGLTIHAESLEFLQEVVALFGFKSARMEMRLKSKTGRTIESLRFSDFRFMFEDHDGRTTGHDDLSYGQKRILTFYYYLAFSPMTVIADELVDGLHHLWIDASIEAMGDRQAFLASQNPLLLDHLEFGSAEQVAATFVTCRAERSGSDKHMIWSNMSTYDAERFFRAYKVDVNHVSEILLSKGLW